TTPASAAPRAGTAGDRRAPGPRPATAGSSHLERNRDEEILAGSPGPRRRARAPSPRGVWVALASPLPGEAMRFSRPRASRRPVAWRSVQRPGYGRAPVARWPCAAAGHVSEMRPRNSWQARSNPARCGRGVVTAKTSSASLFLEIFQWRYVIGAKSPPRDNVVFGVRLVHGFI